MPTIDLRLLTEDAVKKARPPPIPRHAAVPEGSGFRCLWCLKTSPSATSFRGACDHAHGHLLWRAGCVTVCSLCGAFADKQTVLLTKGCRRFLNKRGKYNVKRIFDDHMHPVLDTALPEPHFWRRCTDAQTIVEPSDMQFLDAVGNFFENDPSSTHFGRVPDPSSYTVDDDEAPAAEDPIIRPLLLNTNKELALCVDLGDLPFKKAFYSSTAADDTKYSDAVRIRGPSDRPAPSASSSSRSGRSAPVLPGSSSSWHQNAAVATGAPFATASGSTMRTKFTFPSERCANPLLLNGVMPSSDDMLGHVNSSLPGRLRAARRAPDICEVDFFGLASSSSSTTATVSTIAPTVICHLPQAAGSSNDGYPHKKVKLNEEVHDVMELEVAAQAFDSTHVPTDIEVTPGLSMSKKNFDVLQNLSASASSFTATVSSMTPMLICDPPQNAGFSEDGVPLKKIKLNEVLPNEMELETAALAIDSKHVPIDIDGRSKPKNFDDLQNSPDSSDPFNGHGESHTVDDPPPFKKSKIADPTHDEDLNVDVVNPPDDVLCDEVVRILTNSGFGETDFNVLENAPPKKKYRITVKQPG